MLVKHYSSCLFCMQLIPSIQSLTRIYLPFYFQVYKTKIAVATDCNITDQRRNVPKAMSASLSLSLSFSLPSLSQSFDYFSITFYYRIHISFSDEKGEKGFKGNNQYKKQVSIVFLSCCRHNSRKRKQISKAKIYTVIKAHTCKRIDI